MTHKRLVLLATLAVLDAATSLEALDDVGFDEVERFEWEFLVGLQTAD